MARASPTYQRIISIVCTIAVMITAMTFTVSADEINNQFIDVLDYTTPNTTGENTVSISPQDKVVNFELPFHADVRYIEVLFSISGEFFSPTVYLSDGRVKTPMTLAYLGNNLFRAYTTAYWDDTTYIGIEIGNVPDRRYLTFYDVSYAPESTYPVSIPADGYVHDIGNNSREYYLYHSQAGVSNAPEWTPNPANTSFIAAFDVLDWQAYDYIDIVCTTYCREVTTVSVSHGIGTIPFTANVINPGDSYGLNIVTIRIDLTGIQRNSTNDPLVEITGLGEVGQVSNFCVRYCSGMNILEEPNVIVFWANKIMNSIGSMTSTITTTISGGVTSLKVGLNDIVSSISEWGQKIIDVLTGTGDTSQMQEDVENAKQELGNASDVMNDFTRPPVEEVVPDLNPYLETGSGSDFSQIMTWLFKDNTVTTITTAGVAALLLSIILGV